MKLLPKVYKEVDFLTMEQIQREAFELVSSNKCKTYREELNYVLDSFLNLLLKAKYQGGSEDFYTTYQDEIKKTNDNIKKCVSYYLNGRINSSFISFNKRWIELWKGNFDKSSTITNLDVSTVLFKIREREEDIAFAHKDFFHIPFSKRGIIRNNRFSISGYPCLYLGRSLYTCWEETRRPKLSKIAAVGFRVEKKLRLLDLRLLPVVNSKSAEQNKISLIPYILASSIRVHSEGENFKPEYIIPQLLLHSVIKKDDRGLYDYDGVIYSSTRNNLSFSDRGIDLYDNIAIPVMSNRYKEYDRILASFFTETPPVYYEHEYLKGLIHGSNSTEKNVEYSKTPFFDLEKIIAKETFEEIQQHL